jgi:hypothetical protein
MCIGCLGEYPGSRGGTQCFARLSARIATLE